MPLVYLTTYLNICVHNIILLIINFSTLNKKSVIMLKTKEINMCILPVF